MKNAHPAFLSKQLLAKMQYAFNRLFKWIRATAKTSMSELGLGVYD
jgi:hypothetical protein